MNSPRLRQDRALYASLLSALALVPISSIAQAPLPDDVETVSEVVGYGDLNIHSEVGRKTLLKRINLAVNRVCAESTNPRGLRQREFRSCLREKLDDALAQVDRPILTEATVVVEHPHREAQTLDDTKQPTTSTLNHKGVFVRER